MRVSVLPGLKVDLRPGLFALCLVPIASPLVVALCVPAFVIVGWILYPLYLSFAVRGAPEAAVESFFVNETGAKKPFPSLQRDEGSVTLSVVVPAYNEQSRLPRMLDETIGYLERRRSRDAAFSWEVVVVDDGSKDQTMETALAYTKKYGSACVRVLQLAKNHGKGGAVMKGMLRARGDLLLMADADGATRIGDVERLEEAMAALLQTSRGGFVVGSRFHMAHDDAARRTGVRGFVSMVFGIVVAFLVPGGVRDTQCGFKLMSRTAAREIIPRQKIWGWEFDCELIYLCVNVCKMPVAEVAVHWVDVAGSKLSVVSATLEIVRDLVLMRVLYGLGVW